MATTTQWITMASAVVAVISFDICSGAGKAPAAEIVPILANIPQPPLDKLYDYTYANGANS